MHRVFFPPFDIDCQSQLLHGLIIPLGDLLCFCCLVLFFFFPLNFQYLKWLETMIWSIKLAFDFSVAHVVHCILL